MCLRLRGGCRSFFDRLRAGNFVGLFCGRRFERFPSPDLRFWSPDAEVLTPPVGEIDEANPLPPVVEPMLVEQVQIRRALAANRGNIAKTARQLGLSRQALYR